MRRLENYVRKYGPEFGPVLYHTLQSQAAHAGVSARLRRKIEMLSGKTPTPSRAEPSADEPLPLFQKMERVEEASREESPVAMAVGA